MPLRESDNTGLPDLVLNCPPVLICTFSGAARHFSLVGIDFMRKYILKRILMSIVILFFVAFIIYTIMRAIPTSYVEAIARERSNSPGAKSYSDWLIQL